MLEELSRAIAAVSNIRDTIVAFPATLVDEAEDLKRAELRLGVGSKGPLPTYSQPYLVYKSTLESYLAPSGKADLFVTGKWAASIKTEENGGVLTNTLDNPPDYADDVADYSGGEPEGWSDSGAENFTKMAGARLLHKLNTIIDV